MSLDEAFEAWPGGEIAVLTPKHLLLRFEGR
jgi:hypothetical protein